MPYFLKNKAIDIIAEVKTQSPFGYKSEKSWDELFNLANTTGDIISIHTDARWGGSFELLTRARSLTKKPILAKGIHTEDALIQKAITYGADWVLVVGRIPKLSEHILKKCLIEPYTLAELAKVPQELRVVWNSRDLITGGVKRETFAQARELFSGWLCQASNIRSVSDIDLGADAVLIGTHLENFIDNIG